MVNADYTRHKIRLIMYLRNAGIMDTRVLAAMEKVPRELFVPLALRDQAYEDMTLPIGRGQTISQPLVVSTMTQALEIGPRHKVLEIGTGSGYQTAILAHLCLRVYSIERHKPLLMQAEKMLQELKLRNVTAMAGDGMKGWAIQAPFDAIICTAAAPGKPPQALLDQLKPGGILVIPVALENGQVLRRYKKEGEDTFAVRDLMPVRFVPLLPNLAREAEQIEADPNLAYA
jgi:protein-L-isoaspartate(D-aspartate) O-methyltransferase